ncbi:MAG: hypothetical protein IPL26_28425 [Leptospiraceae bacterium]|nr:hypothetical protein [Leptospiraceae bacterium]
MQTNIHQIIKQTIRFLTFFFLLSLMTGCDEPTESKKQKQMRNAVDVITVLMEIQNTMSNLNSGFCPTSSNKIEITQGQTLGPYNQAKCFKVTVTSNTTVTMVTPGTTTGDLDVWLSGTFTFWQHVTNEDDPTLPINGPGEWDVNMLCNSCSSYSITVP